MIKCCAFCGQEFNTPGRAKCCGAECSRRRKNEEQRKRVAVYPESHRRWMAAHPEKCREAVRKCRDIHREKQREAVRKHRAEHLQEERELERKYYVARHDLMLAKQRKFRSTERGRAGKCAAEHNRRLRKGNIRLTTGILLELKADRHGICPYCGEQIIEGHFDHVIPLVKGGTNARENILWVCATCNRKKKDKGLVEFLMDRNGEQAAMIEDGTALQLVEAALGLERR